MGKAHTVNSSVQRRYRAAGGTWKTVSAESMRLVGDALSGLAPDKSDDQLPLVLQSHQIKRLAGLGLAELEDGTEAPLHPGTKLPLGYHRLHQKDGRSRSLIITPSHCHLPETLQASGIAVQLYAARSRNSWGIGDFNDIAALGEWSQREGCNFLLLNPLHAALPQAPVERSPYYPTSRLFRNPLYIAVENVPGFQPSALWQERATALNRLSLIDHDAIAALKMEVLQEIFAKFPGSAEFDAFCAHTPGLPEFTLYCAIAETHGGDWREWPADLKRPDGNGIPAQRAQLRDRIRFHAWLQWNADIQLRTAGSRVHMVQDLAVGFSRGGFDAWRWQDLLVHDMCIGAPPDTFNTKGQDWGLPPFHPGQLQAADYAPFIETLRANFQYAWGLRIDHVMGLQRLWWVPEQLGPHAGAYVKYPFDDLTGLVALESMRAQAVVIGEDLGTVQHDLRVKLKARGFLSYRLLIFEDAAPEDWPRQALAAITTHDLPTVAGLWTGGDVETQLRLGINVDLGGTEQMKRRLASGLNAASRPHDVLMRAHEMLGRTNCMLICTSLEDLAGVYERPNQPGTLVSANPNWSRALPVSIEAMASSSNANRAVAALRRNHVN